MKWLQFSAVATTTVILEGTRHLQTSKAKSDVSLKQFGSILQVLFHCWLSGGIAGLGAHNAMAGGIAVASGFLAGATLQWAVQVGATPVLERQQGSTLLAFCSCLPCIDEKFDNVGHMQQGHCQLHTLACRLCGDPVRWPNDCVK
jgi:hypothetical protein